MSTHSFDDLLVDWHRERIGRRDLLKRAAGIGFTATALAAVFTVLPSSAKSVFAAPTNPFDPPPDWPDTLPWPPFGPGPCFPIKVPGLDSRSTGVKWYIGSSDGSAVKVVGFSAKGREVSNYDFSFDPGGTHSYSLVKGSTRLDGTLSVSADATTLRLAGAISGQEYSVDSKRDGSSAKSTGEVSLDKAQRALVEEYSLVGRALYDTGQTLGLAGAGSGPQASCLGCAVSGAGLSVWGGGCVFTGPAIGACAGGVLVAWGVFVDNCTGACAD